MSLNSRRSHGSRQSGRSSTSRPNETEASAPRPVQEPTKEQAQARVQRKACSQQDVIPSDSSDDELMIPMQLSALTRALLSTEQPDISAEKMQQSEHVRSLSASLYRTGAAARSRIVSIERFPRRQRRCSETHFSPPVSATEASLENNERTFDRPQHFSPSSAAKAGQAKRERSEVETILKSSDYTTQTTNYSSRRSLRPGDSLALTSDFSKVASDATAPTEFTATEASSKPQENSSVKTHETGPRSKARPRRVISVSGSLLSAPARRSRRRQAEEDVDDNEHNSGFQDIESRSCAIGQTAPAPSIFQPSQSPVVARYMPSRPTTQSTYSHHEASASAPTSPKENISTRSIHLQRIAQETPSKESGALASSRDPEDGIYSPKQGPFSDERPSAIESNNAAESSVIPPPLTVPSRDAEVVQSAKKKQYFMKVNNIAYAKMDCIGKGGLGKVYQVATASGTLLALKRVSLANMDEASEKGLLGEIKLLQRLRGVERVIQLIDHELNREKQSLLLLMEAGQVDLKSLLQSHQSGADAKTHRFDITFVRYYWKEMLTCVQAIHAQDVVHSDLKPDNFVLVKGRLKLIDFGIANAIQTDVTTNVHRDNMAGTISYMSPESLMDSTQYAFTLIQNGIPYVPANSATRVVKVGKPSDVWSLGCTLYQMVYGVTPFANLPDLRSRIQAIVDWSYQVYFPTTTEDATIVPEALLQTMRSCLNRDQKDRPSCDVLLSKSDDFLYPREHIITSTTHEETLPMTPELLDRVFRSVQSRCTKGLPVDNREIAAWTDAYWASLQDSGK